MEPSKSTARVAMMLGGMCMGLVGLFITELNIFPTYVIASLRGLFGMGFLLVGIVIRKKFSVLLHLFRKVPLYTVLQGIVQALTILCYFQSIRFIGLASAAFLLYTGPLFGVLFMWIAFHRRPHPWDLGAFIVALFGIALLTQFWQIFRGILDVSFTFGVIFGISAGIALGILNTLKMGLYLKLDALESASENPDPVKTTSEMNTLFTLNLYMAAIATACLFLLFGPFSFSYYKILNWVQWLWVLALGLVPTAIAFTLVNYGLQADHGGDVLIFSYSETIMATLLAILFGQALTWELILGGILILVANVLVLLRNKILSWFRRI
jgi:drug/metabolite transporter (DMT)-like permease